MDDSSIDHVDEEVQGINFGQALVFLKEGHKLQRAGWNGKGQWVLMQEPDEHSLMTQPYIYIKNAQGGYVPWAPSQGDLFAEDWQVVYY